MADNFIQMNPLYGVYSEFQNMVKNIIIKYSYLAEKYETFEIKREADTYVAAKDGLDTFYTYNDYSVQELYAVGITDVSLITKFTAYNGYLQIPEMYRNKLLENRRKSIINNYEEKNEYYRMLNGYPPSTTSSNKFHYIPKEYADPYLIDRSIPVHKIQDHYNKISSGKGDYLISVIEGIGYIDELRSKYPDEEYLNYMGSKRIDISIARKAKNFQLLYINEQNASSIILYEEFTKAYEQARDYHVSTIFIREYRNIIPYYDQFIAACIMLMAIEVTINKQFNLGIDRKYYNSYTLKMLYDVYGIPYNMDIDEYTQRSISQSLNTLIQKKSTDEVFQDITKILGFNDLKIYRYYITKERKFDVYGAPVISYTEKFNQATGEFEKILNYPEMYNVYFQKVEVTDTDFVSAYTDNVNTVMYDEITSNDPFWWEDEDTYKSVWETEYNFVEAKYLSVGLSYKMTEIMYENILLLKLLASMKDSLQSLTFTLPKINNSLTISLYDAIILLFCLTAKKHNLRGEIISIPSQVTSVLDYLHNTDGGDEYLVDSFGFDFAFFHSNNPQNREIIDNITKILDKDESERFLDYIENLSISTETDNTTKVALLNEIFSNIKGLSNYLQYLMSKAPDRKTYETIKEFYNTIYYSTEVKSVFTINEHDPELKRTAKTYFEYLFYYNPELYYALFTPNYNTQYDAYIKANDLNPEDYPIDKYKYDVEYGTIDDFTYSTLNSVDENLELADDMLYYYIDHIISRMESYIDKMKFIYMLNDSSTVIEDLLVKLINFFKSFTVDMLGLDTIYIMDFRAENTLKLFDEIASIKKELELHDNLSLSYKDVIHLTEAFFNDNKDHLSWYDKVLYNVYITLAKDRYGNKYNLMSFSDKINSIESTCEAVADPKTNMLTFLDVVYSSADINLNEKSNNGLFKDRVVKKYYTDN